MADHGDHGGRIPSDNRPTSAPGVGKHSKRHDLERREVPPLHGSDLQQGDISALEQGQRVGAPQTQPPADRTQSQSQPPSSDSADAIQAPDAIEFIGGRTSGDLTAPQTTNGVGGGALETWNGILNRLVSGPGSSGLLAQAYISQMRTARTQSIVRPAIVVNLDDVDAGLEAMVAELETE